MRGCRGPSPARPRSPGASTLRAALASGSCRRSRDLPRALGQRLRRQRRKRSDIKAAGARRTLSRARASKRGLKAGPAQPLERICIHRVLRCGLCALFAPHTCAQRSGSPHPFLFSLKGKTGKTEPSWRSEWCHRVPPAPRKCPVVHFG